MMSKEVSIKQNTYGAWNVKIKEENLNCKLNREGVNLTIC